ncbi:hypothetical protein EsH8_II_000163 [Colletotrichum jinshuiense]
MATSANEMALPLEGDYSLQGCKPTDQEDNASTHSDGTDELPPPVVITLEHIKDDEPLPRNGKQEEVDLSNDDGEDTAWNDTQTDTQAQESQNSNGQPDVWGQQDNQNSNDQPDVWGQQDNQNSNDQPDVWGQQDNQNSNDQPDVWGQQDNQNSNDQPDVWGQQDTQNSNDQPAASGQQDTQNSNDQPDVWGQQDNQNSNDQPDVWGQQDTQNSNDQPAASGQQDTQNSNDQPDVWGQQDNQNSNTEPAASGQQDTQNSNDQPAASGQQDTQNSNGQPDVWGQQDSQNSNDQKDVWGQQDNQNSNGQPDVWGQQDNQNSNTEPAAPSQQDTQNSNSQTDIWSQLFNQNSDGKENICGQQDNQNATNQDEKLSAKPFRKFEHTKFETAAPSLIGTLSTSNGKSKFVTRAGTTRTESPKAGCLLGSNGTIMGYLDRALRTAGAGRDIGPATFVTVVRAETFPMTIRIRHVYQSRNKRYVAALVEIPIYALVDTPRIESHEQNSPAQIKRMNRGGKNFQIRDTVRLLLDVDTSKAWIRRVSVPDRDPSVGEFVNAWWENISTGPSTRQFSITMPPDQQIVSRYMNFVAVAYAEMKASPGNLWLKAKDFFLDPNNPNQLGFKTLQFNNTRASQSNPASIVFHNDISRMLALQMSSYEELELELSATAELAKLPFQAFVVPDVASKWVPDKLDYGITPDETIRSYLVVIPDVSDKQRLFLPDIGQTFKVVLGLHLPEPRQHPVDEVNPRGSTLRAVRYLIEKAVFLQHNHDAEAHEASPEEKTRAAETRDAEMVVEIASTMPKPLTPELRSKHNIPDSIEDHHARLIAAGAYLSAFFPIKVDDTDLEIELMNLFTDVELSVPAATTSLEWFAVRVKAPAGADAAGIYLIVRTPRERGWPAKYASPPMAFNFPSPPMIGPVYEAFSSNNHSNFLIELTMLLEPNETTTRLEMTAVSMMASSPAGSHQAELWDYTARFEDGYHTSVIDRFPSLPLMQQEPAYKSLHEAFKSCPAGLIMYSGGPGSGKTTFAIQTVAHLKKNNDTFRALWTVHSNDLCDDAANKLHMALGLSCRVVRVYPLHRMINAVAGRLPLDSAPEIDPKEWASLSTSAKAVAGCIRAATITSRKDHPLARRDSLVMFALEIAKAHPDFEDFRVLKAFSHRDNEKERQFTEECYRLLAYTLTQVEVIVGTPVALGQIGRAKKLAQDDVGKWTPDVTVIDEIGRMPESQFWIPLACFNTTLILAMGDTRQFKPMSSSNDARGSGEVGAKWKATFGPQRTMSILRRAEKVGALVTHIYINRRNIGGIAEWAKKNIYNGRMNIAHATGPLVDLFTKEMNYILRCDHGRTNSYMVNIGEGYEQKSGTSYVNTANRNYTFALIFKLFGRGFPSTFDVTKQGSIMIITPYTAQLAAYIDDWRSYVANDHIKSRVSFRTIDDSMSAEADIVIFDTVRSDNLGFIPKTERMAVATTRARGAMVTLLNVKEWKRNKDGRAKAADATVNNHLIGYFNWHLARGTVSDTNFNKKGWDLMCETCGQPNHSADKCRSSRRCRNCHGAHHERFCPRGFVSSDTYDVSRRQKTTVESNEPGVPSSIVLDTAVRIPPGTRRTRGEIENCQIPVAMDEPHESRVDARHLLHEARNSLKSEVETHSFLKTELGASSTGFLVSAETALGNDDSSEDLEEDPEEDTKEDVIW